jgi:hypothetical protein
MFEVGKIYEFVTLASSEDGLYETTGQGQITAIDGSLLHIHEPAQPDSDLLAGSMAEQNWVLNTASCFFHSAKLAETR